MLATDAPQRETGWRADLGKSPRLYRKEGGVHLRDSLILDLNPVNFLQEAFCR